MRKRPNKNPFSWRHVLVVILCINVLVPIVQLILASGPSASTPPALPELGVNVHSLWDSSTTYPSEYPLYKTMGAGWIRTDVYWDQIEPANGTMSSYWLGALDEVVATANADGLRSLLTVSGTPSWAEPVGGTTASPPVNPATYATFMAFLAARYQAENVALELWNEPDLPDNFTGASAATYTTLACATYAAVKASSPSTTVVVGAVSGEDIGWLRQAFSSGIAGCFDVVSEHPYSQNLVGADPDTWEPVFITPAVHALMAQYGDGAKPIWFTEFGYSANADGSAPQEGQVTLAEASLYTVRFIQVVADTLPYVPVVMIYEGKDTLSGPTAFEQNLGILQADLTPKPAYGAVMGLYNGTDVPPLPVDPAIPPTVSAASPSSGPSGTAVTITGLDFTGTTQVRFGTVPASFTVNSGTQITATAPSQAASLETIWVTTPSGTNAWGAGYTSASFQYAAPVVSGLSPLSGAGGTVVTITGSAFTGASQVLFGSMPATSVTVNSDTQITATAPFEAAGAETVWVTTPSGTNQPGPIYSYLAPTVTGLSPASGSGGTTVTVNGTSFNGATQVLFGSVAASGVTVNSSTQITAVAPPEAAGTETVWVITPTGVNSSNAAADYRYVVPTVTGVSPASGGQATTVDITGTGFSGATKVAFGGVAATSFSVDSDTLITAVTPPEASGNETIWVTTRAGTNAKASSFDYLKPAVTSLSPSSGPEGTTVTINGADFSGATTVLFGNLGADGLSIISPTQISATAPDQSTGPQTIWVSTPAGTSAGGSQAQYTYTATPQVKAATKAAATKAAATKAAAKKT